MASPANDRGQKRRRDKKEKKEEQATSHVSRSLRLFLSKDAADAAAGRLAPLPAVPSVTRILQQYAEAKRPPLTEPEQTSLADIGTLFDALLGTALCFKEERAQFVQQFQQQQARDGRLSDVYGAWHLLRLLALMPTLLSRAEVAASDAGALKNMASELLAYLERHQALVFADAPLAQ